jgi:hypothetical protein
MKNLQIFYVEYGGNNYTVTSEEVKEQLRIWKKKLKKESKYPNEATIHVVNQLETIQASLNNNSTLGIEIDDTTPVNNETTLLSLDNTSIGLLSVVLIGLSLRIAKKINNSHVYQLRAIENSSEGIQYYDSIESFNQNHP